MHFRHIAFLLAFALAAVGCPGLTEPPISATCTKLADKCKLGNGPLGVCVENKCPSGKTPPCFVCQPQH